MTGADDKGRDGDANEGRPPIALERRAATDGADARLFSPSAARNRDPIRDAFLELGPARGVVLEVGSGTGEHASHIAGAAPELTWRPSDPDPDSRESIDAWRLALGVPNIAPAASLDATAPDWDAAFDARSLAAMVSINMIHIAPFEAAEGLIRGAGRLLADDGRLFLYGPFRRGGQHTAPSNEAFDASLKARDPRWGVRDLEKIDALAEAAGLTRAHLRDMPANNMVLLYARQ
ncbi:MAG: DUF938 domain-containing protein [Pseudomonadota bacterium]